MKRYIQCGIFSSVILILVCSFLQACKSRLFVSQPVYQHPEIMELKEQQEVVIINSETYTIPPPWKGNRLTAPEFDYSDFRLIPVKYTHNGSKIYILNTAHQSLVSLLQAAEKEGVFLKVESAYRSETYQKSIFKRMLAKGRTFDDIVRYVAPPGYSQHVLGTAVDFFPSNWRFADKIDCTWLKENGRRFGFEETYPQFNPMKRPWEPWHWNFTGKNDEFVNLGK